MTKILLHTMNKKMLIAACISAGSLFTMHAQNTGLFTLDEALQRVVTLYPSVKQAEEAINAADANIRMTRSVLFPLVQGSASYAYVNPQMKLSFMGNSFEMNPKNNYSAAISVNQLLYDFGKNRPSIEASKLQKEIAQINTVQVKQNLSLSVIQLYYMLGFTRQAINIKEREKQNYEEMLRQMQIRQSAGAATKFDVLNTKVSLTNVQTQLIELATSNLNQLKNLSILTDTLLSDNTGLSSLKQVEPFITPLSDLVNEAYAMRPEMKVAENQVKVAELEESAAARAYNPSLNFQAQAGGKNGYPMDLDKMKFNYQVGASLSVPIYEGGRRAHGKQLAKTKKFSAMDQMEVVKKQIDQEVSQNYYNLQSSYAKIENLQMQVEMAGEAYNQATANYRAGSITNLEYITSATNLSDAQLMLEQAKINYWIQLCQLQVSIGKVIY
ncbi:MAG: TolC family protein [Bacteroidales bacterium]